MKNAFNGSTGEELGDNMYTIVKVVMFVGWVFFCCRLGSVYHAPIAQLDRAVVFETKGSRFES